MKNHVVLQLDPTPRNARNSEATFVTLKGGRILLAWSKFIGNNHSDFGAGVIAARWSDDGGLTWSKNETAANSLEGDEMNPAIAVDGTCTIGVAWRDSGVNPNFDIGSAYLKW